MNKIYFIFFIFISSISNAQEIGLASYYTVKSSSNITASGEEFKDEGLTCAMRNRDFGSFYEVCNLANNKCVIVKNNDYGPNKRLKNRIVDLTPKAFSMIGDLDKGLIKVNVIKLKGN